MRLLVTLLAFFAPQFILELIVVSLFFQGVEAKTVKKTRTQTCGLVNGPITHTGGKNSYLVSPADCAFKLNTGETFEKFEVLFHAQTTSGYGLEVYFKVYDWASGIYLLDSDIFPDSPYEFGSSANPLHFQNDATRQWSVATYGPSIAQGTNTYLPVVKWFDDSPDEYKTLLFNNAQPT